MKKYINAATVIPGVIVATVLQLSFGSIAKADIVLGFGTVAVLLALATLEYRLNWKRLLGLYSGPRKNPPCNGAGAIRPRFFAPTGPGWWLSSPSRGWAARPTRMAAGCMGVRFLRADGVGRGN